MATLVAQRLSRTLYLADGTTTSWNFNFAGGYIDKAHVKVAVTPVGGVETAVPITEANFIGPAQLLLTPPVSAGALLVIYRDTPKDLPLVDFTNGSGLSDTALDVNAKQAVFIAAELSDTMGAVDVNAAIAAAATASAASAAAVSANAEAQLALDSLRGENTVIPLSGDGTTVAFAVTQPDAGARCDVFVQGIYQHTSTWSLSSGVLTFAAAPLAGTDNIEVVISTNIPADELSPLAAAAAASAAAAANSALVAADAARLTVGTVTTLAPGASATATITGLSGSQSLNLGIPQGPAGANGTGTGDMTKAVYDPNDDGKVTYAVNADAVPWGGITEKPTTFAPSAHTHGITDVLNLSVELAGKAATSHTHAATAISDSTSVGRSVLTAATATDARIAIGAGDGYLNIPTVPQSANYTLALTDAGKLVLHPSADTSARTFTIPSNASMAFPVGTAVTFVNQSGAGSVTIAITTDTLRLAGAGTTGNRTLAANGLATAIKITSTEWMINGAGLT